MIKIMRAIEKLKNYGAGTLRKNSRLFEVVEKKCLNTGLNFRRGLKLLDVAGAKNQNLARPRLEHTTVAGQIKIKPLSEPLDGFEDLEYVDPKSFEPFSTKYTKLPNGLRIVTEPTLGEYCTLGVIVDAGVRYEANYTQGTCHFLEKLAFGRSANFQDVDETQNILERCGGLIDCQSTKDSFLYASSCHNKSAETLASMIADTIFRPIIEKIEMDNAMAIIECENDTLARNPECEPLLTDYIHAAAFRDNTVGLSKYCQPENIQQVSQQDVYTFMSQYYTPSRIVLAGVGVEHELLEEAGKKFFSEHDSVWAKNPQVLLHDTPPLDNSLAQYTGGEVRIKRDLSQMALGPTPFPNLAHVMIGFQGASVSEDDYVPFCVLQSMLGGGGSFSAGGPGKGMFTRLYIDVMHRYNWIYNATAFNHSYGDCGLFCIRASAPPNRMGDLPEIILREFLRLAKGVEDGELERAKVQLKSHLMMNLEQRPVVFEDLSRQIMSHGIRRKPQYFVNAIERVENRDITRIAERMLNSKPAVVGYGDLSYFPSYDRIRSLI
ncbi:peptidase m16 inactive domain-containing protein [Ditylenchus destructor]|nr:peptidase m16 inactive domain-containing protein [Ditylenchus destructor]